MKTIPCPRRTNDPHKCIEYAYQSSTMAGLFGEAAHGCRFVSTPTHAHGPFDTYQAARAFADTLPGPYSKWST